MTQWEDVTPTPREPDYEETPFGGVEQVDGLVYAPEAASPELQWQAQQVEVPLPPVRERPQPRDHRPVEPWKPGPDPEPARPAEPSRALRMLAMTVIPVTILAGLGWLVYRTMLAYGF